MVVDVLGGRRNGWWVVRVVAGKESMDWKVKEFKFLMFIVRGF